MKINDTSRNLFAVCLALFTWGCGPGDTGNEPVFPRNLSLTEHYVEMDPAASQRVAIRSGNGLYQVRSVDPAIASARIDGDAIEITGVASGKTSVVVTDKEGISDYVQVYVFRELRLEANEIEVPAGDPKLGLPAQPKSLTVVSGNGGYSVTSDREVKFTVDGDRITIEAYLTGEVTATVEDRTGRTQTLRIVCTDPYAEFLASNADVYYYDKSGDGFRKGGIPQDKVVNNNTFQFIMRVSINTFQFSMPASEKLTVGPKQGCGFYFSSTASDATKVGLSASSPESVQAFVLKNDGKKVWIVFFNDALIGWICRPVMAVK